MNGPGNVFDQDRATIAGKLVAGGVEEATTDPRSPVPCVLVDAPIITGTEGIGGWRVDQPVQVIAAPPGNAAALSWMLDHVEIVMRLLDGPTSAIPGTVIHNDVDCPAYTITFPRSIANPEC